MIRLIGTVPPMVKTLLAGGGVAVGTFMEFVEMQDGIQALDVVLGLQVLLLSAVWVLGREVAAFRAGLETKATPTEVREIVKVALTDYRQLATTEEKP